jgi:hypothetical protein
MVVCSYVCECGGVPAESATFVFGIWLSMLMYGSLCATAASNPPIGSHRTLLSSVLKIAACLLPTLLAGSF